MSAGARIELDHVTKRYETPAGVVRAVDGISLEILIHRPSLIVADEPTGSLDAESAAVVVDLLLAAQRSSGATLVLVTHEPEVARRLDGAVGMLDGRLAGRAGRGA